MNDLEIKKLINEVFKIKENAYAPYSKFKVGALVIDDKNKKYFGVNVENQSYGLTVCAERNAIFTGVTNGMRKIKTIILVSDNPEMISPCGACREVISEFATTETEIILADHNYNYKIYKIDELLPLKFKL